MNTSTLTKELHTLQKNTIGLFKPSFSKDIWLVTSNDDGYLKCISFGVMGGLHTLGISSTKGDLLMFKDDNKLTDIMSDPIEFKIICDTLHGKK